MNHNTTGTTRHGIGGTGAEMISGAYKDQAQQVHAVPAGGLGCLLITIALVAIAAGAFFAFVM